MHRVRRYFIWSVVGTAGVILWLTLRPRPSGVPGSSARLAGVARVGERVLTEADFTAMLQQRARRTGETAPSREEQQALLEEWIRSEAIYSKALASGFSRRPEIEAAIRNLVVSKFQEEQLKKLPTSVNASALETYYRQNPSLFTVPAAVKGALIFLRASPKMMLDNLAQRRADAERIRQRALAGEDFTTLAAKYSEDQATRYVGGETGWLSENPSRSTGQLPHVAIALLSATKPGEILPLLETAGGIYVLKLLEQRPATRQPLSQVRDVIRQQLVRAEEQARQQTWLTEMKAGVPVEINRALFERLTAPHPVSAPPALPGSQTAQAMTP